MSTRKKYSKEFKLETINLVLQQGYPINEVAANLGTHASMINRWIREYRQLQQNAFKGNGCLSTEQQELRRLREENRKLKMERDILKKAAAFFAKEGQ